MPSANVQHIITVASHLNALDETFVFLGGACVDLLLTEKPISAIRPSMDVDTIVQVSGHIEYSKLEERLRDQGFRHDVSPNAPRIRWIIEGIKLDIIPTDSSITGFNVEWLSEAVRHADEMKLTEDITISLVSPPYFLAAKLEAFHDRGEGDFMGSEDIEDIVAVFDGRPELAHEVRRCEAGLNRHLNKALSDLLKNPDFVDALLGHTTRRDTVMERMRDAIG